MNQLIAFSCTREVAEAKKPPALQARKMTEVARQSLINVAGLTYPNIQPVSAWNQISRGEDDGSLAFVFDGRPPVGDVRFQPDLSFVATREPTDSEVGPVIFLEALTWEFVFNVKFFERVVHTLGRPGTFSVGVLLTGFQDAQVDWAGFREASPLPLTNWRFKHPRSAASFESQDVTLPATTSKSKADLVEKLSEVIAELSFAVMGLRRSPQGRSEDNLVLTRPSIKAVVEAALSKVK